MKTAFRALLAAGLVTVFCACAPGVKWQFDFYENVQRQATQAQRLTFVYFRSCVSPRCTEFEEHVLKMPEILAATEPFVCVPLEITVPQDTTLAERWGIKDVPAIAITAPDGTLIAKDQAPITKEALLAALRDALAKHGGTAQPVQAQVPATP